MFSVECIEKSAYCVLNNRYEVQTTVFVKNFNSVDFIRFDFESKFHTVSFLQIPAMIYEEILISLVKPIQLFKN